MSAGCAIYSLSSSDDKAVSVYDTVLTKAQKYAWERRYDEALELLDEVERIEGPSEELQLMRGHIYYILEYFDRARKVFNGVLAREPGNHDAVVHLWYLDAIEKGFTAQLTKRVTPTPFQCSLT